MSVSLCTSCRFHPDSNKQPLERVCVMKRKISFSSALEPFKGSHLQATFWFDLIRGRQTLSLILVKLMWAWWHQHTLLVFPAWEDKECNPWSRIRAAEPVTEKTQRRTAWRAQQGGTDFISLRFRIILFWVCMMWKDSFFCGILFDFERTCFEFPLRVALRMNGALQINLFCLWRLKGLIAKSTNSIIQSSHDGAKMFSTHAFSR